MKLAEAKRLSLPAILAVLGHHPLKTLKNGHELWYLSPFRDETSASFHTTYRGNLGIWIWNDFVEGGGNVIDFAMRYFATDVRGAIEQLSSLAINSDKSENSAFNSPKKGLNKVVVSDRQPTLVLTQTKRLSMVLGQTTALSNYLTVTRRLDPLIASNYLVEVHFINSQSGKQYFAAGMKNEHQGYEIRNPWFKSTVGRKGISVVKGKFGTNVAVFEGFMDFLSALTFYQRIDVRKFEQLIDDDVIIMNSLAFQQRTNEVLLNSHYSKIELFLDNDLPGKKATSQFLADFGGITEDCSHVYNSVVDFNEFLINRL
ncbi:MAG: hypothetical protein BGO21_26090 [Dyadobacter sp. 50-39]|uniref:toprim domain-containing protein n=1 Tax=Dyadobacter sp. 50-39 TaxID=1895756 RepID=UPI00095998C2|nr:toprim domain-containing protein [Dyadobacter sp. 50-39]OJV17355.1 MAG: hypothetical protein BGO21_26090 [Dyadobacter sp. 50-39]